VKLAKKGEHEECKSCFISAVESISNMYSINNSLARRSQAGYPMTVIAIRRHQNHVAKREKSISS
jgi:hypothetical protein